MSRFVRVKHTDRFTKSQGNYIWLNLDNVISVDEDIRGVLCTGQEANFYVINEESMPTLLEALKGGAEE